MIIKCLGSSSKGNCYVLEFAGKFYVVEAGIITSDVLKCIDFRLEDIVGVFITHEHLDHSKYAMDWLKKGILVYATAGTADAIGILNHHNVKLIEQKGAMVVENAIVQTLQTFHDVKEPCSFIFRLTEKKEKASICFATDTYKYPYTIKDIDCFMIEANYDKEIIKGSGAHHRNRVVDSHLPIDEAIRFLKRSVDDKTKKIILLHLSDENSNEERFTKRTEKETGINTICADKGRLIKI